MTVKLLTEQHLEFLSLKGGSTCSSESTLVKMLHFWKSHVMAQLSLYIYLHNLGSSCVSIHFDQNFSYLQNYLFKCLVCYACIHFVVKSGLKYFIVILNLHYNLI